MIAALMVSACATAGGVAPAVGGGVGAPEAGVTEAAPPALGSGPPPPAIAPPVAGADEAPATVPAEPGVHELELSIDDVRRAARVHVPVLGAAHPVLLALHPLGGTALGFERATGLGPAGTADGVVVVFPQGVGLSWNGGAICCQPALGRVDDLAYVRALVERLAQDLPIDRGRVWATGFSNGGFLAYRLACQAPDVVSAIAPVAATYAIDCAPSPAVALLHVHGIDDDIVPYEDVLRAPPERPIPRGAVETTSAFAAALGCGDATVTPFPGGTTTAFPGCAGGVAVELVSLEGVGHQWPRDGWDATSEVLRFLASQPGRS